MKNNNASPQKEKQPALSRTSGPKVRHEGLEVKALEKSDLEKLAGAKWGGDFTLSFYLGLKSEVNFRSEANSVLSQEEERIKKDKKYSKAAKKKILEMLGLIKKELNFLRLPQDTRTLVFFLDGGSEIMAYRVPVYIHSKIVVEADYYIYPLVKVMEEFSRYLVVTVERDKAEFFSIFLGEIEGEPEMLLSDVPQKIHTSTSDDWHGRREKKIERHIEDHLNRHFKAVALRIRDYLAGDGFDHLIIGAHGEIKAQFPGFLDKRSVEKVIGFFSLPHPNHGVIREKSMAIIDEYEKNIEEKIVNDLLSSIGGKGWEAVMGIGSVLENFYLRKIKMFVIGANYEKLGFACGHCHHMSLLPGDCLSCGGKTAKVSDLADEIIEEAIKNKIKIKQLLHEHKKFDSFGIGAFLKDY